MQDVLAFLFIASYVSGGRAQDVGRDMDACILRVLNKPRQGLGGGLVASLLECRRQLRAANLWVVLDKVAAQRSAAPKATKRKPMGAVHNVPALASFAGFAHFKEAVKEEPLQVPKGRALRPAPAEGSGVAPSRDWALQKGRPQEAVRRRAAHANTESGIGTVPLTPPPPPRQHSLATHTHADHPPPLPQGSVRMALRRRRRGRDPWTPPPPPPPDQSDQWPSWDKTKCTRGKI